MFLASVGPTCRGNLTLDLEVCGYIFGYVVQPDLRYMYRFVYVLDIRRLRQISGSWLWAKQFRRVQKWGQKNILSGKWSLRGLWRRWMDLWALSPCLRGLALGLRPKGHVFSVFWAVFEAYDPIRKFELFLFSMPNQRIHGNRGTITYRYQGVKRVADPKTTNLMLGLMDIVGKLANQQIHVVYHIFHCGNLRI